MQVELEVRRRALLLAYRRYFEADRAFVVAAREARAWFPIGEAPPRWTIGQPGSRLRALHDRRERALQRLQVARQKLEHARLRLAARRATPIQVRLRLPA